MNPLERLMALLEGRKEDVDRLPVCCSARTLTLDSMKIFDAYWPEAHRDPERMARLAAGVYELTGNENISVPFDMTLEAEALGAPREYFEGKIKWISVKRFIATDIYDYEIDIPEDPSEFVERGRIPALEFIAKASEEGARVIAMSTMMTPTLMSMKAVEEQLEKKGLKAKVKTIIGGGTVTE